MKFIHLVHELAENTMLTVCLSFSAWQRNAVVVNDRNAKSFLWNYRKCSGRSLQRKFIWNFCCKQWKTVSDLSYHLSLLKCINAVPREAQKLLPELHDEVQEICFQEFRTFVKRWVFILSSEIGDSSRLRFWDLMKLMFFFHCVFSLVCRYSEEQYVDLKKRAQTDNPETIHFLKTLKTCKELRWVVSVFLWQMLIQFLWAL